jgi:competence protein ComEC
LIPQPLLSRLPGYRLPALLWLLLVTMAFGAIRYQTSLPQMEPDFIAWYNDRGATYFVEGVVIKPPDERDGYTQLRIAATRLRAESEPEFKDVHGRLVVSVWEPGEWRYGDVVRLEGKLVTPPEREDFSYREILARQGVYSQMPDASVAVLSHNAGNFFLRWVYGFKARGLEMVYRLWPDPEASILAGILLGVESGIPRAVNEAFIATGTSHIIVISGFNVTLVSGLFSMIFGRLLGARRGAVVALLGISVYTILVGGDASVVRAAILGGLSLFAAQVGRRQTGMNSLALAAMLMALVNPEVLWDVSFQLSYAATLGLVFYGEPLTEGFMRLASRWLTEERVKALTGPVSEYFLLTLAAQLTTLPVIIYTFKRLSLSALVANPLILPAQPPIMGLGGLAILCGMVYEPLGRVVGMLVWPFVLYTTRIVEWFAQFGGPGIYLGQTALPLVAVYYGLIFALPNGWKRLQVWIAGQPERRTATLRSGALAGLAIFTVLAWRAVFDIPDGRLHLTLLNVGNGEALLVETPGGRHVLIDGGSSTSRLSDGLGRRMPAFDRHLEYLVVAAPGEEHIEALGSNLLRFPPRQVLWAGLTHGNPQARYLQALFKERSIPVVELQVGHRLDLGDGAVIEVLASGRRGATLLISYGNFSLLLPVGLDFEAMDALLEDARLVELTVLLLAEGGYGPVNPPAWITKLHPQVILISVAANDWQGRPDKATLTAIDGYTVYRTDINGWVQIATDGEGMWLEVEKR